MPARYEHGLAIAIGDRVSPLSTECASRDLRPRRSLMALPFTETYEFQHEVYGLWRETRRDDLVPRLFLVDVAKQDGIEDIVGR